METNLEQYIEHEVQIRLLNSKHDEIYKEFEKIDRKFDKIDQKFDQIDHKFDQIDQKFDQKFDRLDAKIESRFLLLIGLIITSIVLPVFLHALKLI